MIITMARKIAMAMAEAIAIEIGMERRILSLFDLF